MPDCENGSCYWCGDDDPDWFRVRGNSRLLSGPEGELLRITDRKVCVECFDSIKEEFERTGDLTQPITAYGGAA